MGEPDAASDGGRAGRLASGASGDPAAFGKAMAVAEGHRTAGMAAEVAAIIGERSLC